MNPYIEMKAKTVDEALTKAMMELGVPSELLEYEVVEKGSSGFLGIGAKKAVIRVRKKDSEPETTTSEKKEKKPSKKQDRFSNPDRVARPVTEKPVEKKEEKKEAQMEEPASDYSVSEGHEKQREITPIDVTPCFGTAETFLKSVFDAMDMDVNLDIKADDEVNTIAIELKGDDMGVLIGKRGQTLDALQYLTSIVVNAEQTEYVRVKVDTENYRVRRKQTLENLANNLASKVKRTGKPVILEPMNAYERRIIHSSLQGNRYVTTHSEGEDPFRKVVIVPNGEFKPYQKDRRRGNYRGGRRGGYNRGNREGGYRKNNGESVADTNKEEA